MLIKFLNRGTGKVSKAIDYLIADRDSKEELRHGVKILDGDSTWVRIVGDNLETKHKYTSAVLSWTVEDQPSAEQICETLDEFYATAFAGLDEQRRSALAVLHEEQDGTKHVHVLMLRTDLKTGLAYNPAPPGHEYDFNCVRDYLNYKYNWSDPQDPLRKQIYKTSRVERQQRIAALTEAKPINNTQKEQLELKSLLIESVNTEFARGAIQKHDDVKKFLSQFGGVRSVKAHGDRPSYISFSSPAFNKDLRLRGQIFEEEFNEQQANRIREAIRREQDLARTHHPTAHRTTEQRSSESGYVYQWQVPKQYHEWTRECQGRRAESERITAATYSTTSRSPSDPAATAEAYATIGQRIRNVRDLSEDKIRERKRQVDRGYDGPGF